MPFIANTPESLLGRADSLNPKTTCHGITSSGRPCRRPLNESTLSAPQMRRGRRAPTDLTDPALYCWQHKDQAARRTASSPGPRISGSPSGRRRSSIDTLTERLGITGLGGTQHEASPSQQQNNSGSGNGKKKSSTLTLCCCFTIPIPEEDGDDEGVNLPPRPKPQPVQPVPGPGRRYQLSPSGRPSTHSRRSNHAALIPPSASPETAALLMAELAKPISAQDDPGYIYMFWLTPDTEPAAPPKEAARSLLLSPPPATTTPGGTRPRSPSDVLAAFANTAFDVWADLSDDDSGPMRSTRSIPRSHPRDAQRDRARRARGKQAGKKTLLLKIGRATNVQRRLNEWKRQCGYNLSLIRYYPYIPSSFDGSSSSGGGSGSGGIKPRKMPHSHKVERLIHLELAGAGLRVLGGDRCAACGREHREWFEVEATRGAVREVDDVIKRWIEWDEGLA